MSNLNCRAHHIEWHEGIVRPAFNHLLRQSQNMYKATTGLAGMMGRILQTLVEYLVTKLLPASSEIAAGMPTDRSFSTDSSICNIVATQATGPPF